jgi:hypothetical protein
MKRVSMKVLGLTALGAVAAVHTPAWAAAEDFGFRVGVGGEYSTGDYGGGESIDEVYVPVNFIFDAPRVTARVTVPYLTVRAPEGTVTEGPDGETVIGEGPMKTESGIGDVLAALTVYDVLVLGAGDYAMDLTGKVKFGTASADDGLGTGETDYSIEANLFRFFEKLTLLGVGGYVIRGDPPDVDLQDGFLASLGTTYRVSEKARAGLFYDYREASVEGGDALQEVSATLSSRLGTTWWGSGYVLAGIGDGSPDWGLGLSFTAAF